jgi:hypothetical protein
MEVSLEILEPANNANVVGTNSVRLRGRQVSTGHSALFFKWYSSQVAPPSGSTDASIRVPAGGTDFDMTVALPVGTQVITFTAKDQPGESVAEMQNVLDAGMAGGPPAATAPCMIHVVRAGLLLPLAGATVSKAAATLELEAPPQWEDASFQEINQISFRFRFTPAGAPAGRPSADFTPTLVFDNDPPPAVLRFVGALPAGLGTGNYQLTLLAEKSGDNPAVHQVSRNVNVIP